MINLDQVRTLEWKVKQAVQLIVHLRRENDTLRSRLSDTEVRLQELETLLESFKATQNEMESGIRSALEDLDNLEVGPAPQVTGPVDSLNYPPESAPQPTFAEEDPAAVFDKAPVQTFVAEDPAALVGPASTPVAEQVVSEPAKEMTFEEEYAALAAAEAEGAEAVASVPESVELEESVDAFVSEDESAFLADPAPEGEPQPVQPEQKQPEQPGLGIF